MRLVACRFIAVASIFVLSSCAVFEPGGPTVSDFTIAGDKHGGAAPAAVGRGSDHRPKAGISAVTDLSSGLSVVGKDSPGAIIGSLAGTAVRLTISGDIVSDKKKRPADWTIPMPVGVFTQTWIGKGPSRRVLIDGCIPLQPVNTPDDEPDELTVQVPRLRVLDWYLKGQHTLTVQQGNQSAVVEVRFGTPEPARRSLGPVVSAAQVIRLDDMKLRGVPTDDDDEECPNVLRLEGDNFLLDYHRMWATIDGVRAYFHAVQILDGPAPTMIGYLHLPKHFVHRSGQHRLQVASPFGMTFRSF